MKQIKASIRSKTQLILEEDGIKGDYIDLTSLSDIDFSAIEQAIELGKDTLYKSKLEDVKALLNAQHKTEIANLENELKKITAEKETAIKFKENEVENNFKDEINVLKNTIENLKQNNATELALALEQEKNKVKDEYMKEIATLKAALQSKEQILNAEADVKLTNALRKQKEDLDAQLKAKDDIINNLQRNKASLNVKQTGEDLEAWCDNEITQYLQTGLLNCTWSKDNKVLKNDGEVKGSKADFIFRVFTNEDHENAELLTSVCLEMKDENPDSVTKQTNESFYKQLDINRKKKECKYAVLVSNLENDKPNALPIWKVRGYEDMYVVRPGYMMVFLNMLVSLTTRFQLLTLSKEAEMLEIKDKLKLIAEFDAIKKTYLEKPLEALEKDIEIISKANEDIVKASGKITERCMHISNSYISDISKKISKFEVQLEKAFKKVS